MMLDITSSHIYHHVKDIFWKLFISSLLGETETVYRSTFHGFSFLILELLKLPSDSCPGFIVSPPENFRNVS